MILDDKIKISQIGDCKVIETSGWILHFLKNGSFRLLPPAIWILELVDLIENKTISHSSAKNVIEIWQIETLKRINNGINKLKMLF
ncbi:MAG: hypothetical protein AABW93_02770 [Nanoarchaeota archaeon]